MGGAADRSDRASSPLKRRASSMEPDSNNEDVEMVNPHGPADTTTTTADVSASTSPASRDEASSQDQTMADDQDSATSVTGSGREQDSEIETPRPPESVEAHIKSIKTLVEELNSRPLDEGEVCFLVSRHWLSQVLPPESEKKGMPADLTDIGQVDNSDIILETVRDPSVDKNASSLDKYFVRLKANYGTEQFEVFPAPAWELLMKWPGLKAHQLPIRRVANNTSEPGNPPNVMFEFHPPVFAIHRVWSANSPIAIDSALKQKNPPPFKIMRASSTKYQDLILEAKILTNIARDQRVRLWSVPQQPAPTGHNVPTPPASPNQEQAPESTPSPFKHLLVELTDFTALERDSQRVQVEHGDQTNNSNYNGSMTIRIAGINQDQALVLEEHIEGTTWVTTYSPSKASATLPSRSQSTTNLTAPARNTKSARASPAPSGPMTRGRSSKSGRTLGCVGLSNLGNTCYMNSALQCIRSVEELTKYFLAQEWKEELNKENVLAHNGDVAAAYAHLLQEIYKDSAPNSFAPRMFKNTIGRYAPAFSGYGQQDSQEFIGFLLDGLQEDLSRIKKKPYIEKPDSTDEMIGDDEAIRKMAEQVWDITKKRDDSVIADLFTGLYKSTLVCPECGKVSITFDPFNNLTLPLPVENKWSHTIKFFPLNESPIDIRVELDKHSSMKALKEFVSSRTNIPADRLFGAEEFKNKFYKIYTDLSVASEEIGNNDNAWIFELEAKPTNFGAKLQQQQQRYGGMHVRSMLDDEDDEQSSADSWNNEQAQQLIVPVIHRRPGQGGNLYTSKKWQLAGAPHFIVVNQEEARSEDAIRRKVLEKVATLVKSPVFDGVKAPGDESDKPDTPEVVGEPDSSSSTDGNKVVAQSVLGEDDMVDIQMKDADTKEDGGNLSVSGATSSKRPSWVDRKNFLPGELQGLFELGFFTETNSALPTGMNGVSEDRDYPRLSSRVPEVHSEEQNDNEEGTASNEDSDSDQAHDNEGSSQTRMASESEEDEIVPVVKTLPQRPKPNKGRPNTTKIAGSRKKMKKHKTYGKKGNKRLQQQQRQLEKEQTVEESFIEDPPESVADGGPLIRLKEGLVVDWSEIAFDHVFGSRSENITWETCDTLPDLELDEIQATRSRRRKHGITIDACLDEFERDEILSEQDMWYCPRCKEHRRASKKFDLWKTPDILVIHLKRFSSSGYRRDKLDVLVDFPIENLDINSRVLHKEDGKKEVYDLIGVDCHWGGLGGGHYTAFAKNFVDGQWYEYNDSSVTKTSTSKMVDNSAYLLFYRRQSEKPLGGPKFEEILEKFVEQPGDGEELPGSGEGQRLGGGSSQNGSSSASQGAEATHQPENPGGNQETGFVLRRDDGQQLHQSIEDDEGIDVTADEDQQSSGFNPVNSTNNWSFDALSAGPTGLGFNGPSSPAGSIATDEAQHDSSGDEREALSPPMMDFENDTANYPGMSHYSLTNQGGTAVELPRQDGAGVWDHDPVLEVPVAGDKNNESDDAAEIHIDDNDRLKL